MDWSHQPRATPSSGSQWPFLEFWLGDKHKISWFTWYASCWLSEFSQAHHKQSFIKRLNDYTQPPRPSQSTPQVGHGQVDHQNNPLLWEEITVAMETPFRTPIIPGTHATLRLIFQNSYWSICFGYERWQTWTVINTQCAATGISGVILLKRATL